MESTAGASSDLLQLRAQYRRSSRKRRAELLDAFVQATGFHRKSAIRALNRPPARPQTSSGVSRYDSETVDALVAVWNGLGRPCSKRLQPVVFEMARVFGYHAEIRLSGSTLEQLQSVSAATIDRLLRPFRDTDSDSSRWRERQRTAARALALADRARMGPRSAATEQLEALSQRLRVRVSLYVILYQRPMATRNIRRFFVNGQFGVLPDEQRFLEAMAANGPARARCRLLRCLLYYEQPSAARFVRLQESYMQVNPVKTIGEIDELIESIQRVASNLVAD
jgi:hypothetical protein